MAIPRRLTVVFTFFYIGVIIYIFLFLMIPEFQQAIIEARNNIIDFTKGSNYLISLILTFIVCLIGNASVGFPIPYPFVLFSFSQSIYLKYINFGLSILQVLENANFWLEISIYAIVGGLGSIIGELTSFFIGVGAKKVVEKTSRDVFRNVKGFGRLILDHPKSTYFYIFLAAALPIPDDPLWIALGMLEKRINFTKCLFWGWMGKNITTYFYVILPIAIALGFNTTGITMNAISSVITEALMLLITLTVMFFILAFNWDKYLEKRYSKKNNT